MSAYSWPPDDRLPISVTVHGTGGSLYGTVDVRPGRDGEVIELPPGAETLTINWTPRTAWAGQARERALATWWRRWSQGWRQGWRRGVAT